MKSIALALLLLHLAPAISTADAGTAGDAQAAQSMRQPTLNQLLDNIEALYTRSAFSADFKQTSTIKAMEISDTAHGKLMVAYPGKMRWEYIAPDPQLIITDGQSLWIYRPLDYQVMVGSAAVFFAEGKGAGFLSDIGSIRRDFSISLEEVFYGDYYSLKLIPKEQNYDLVSVFLLVDKKTFYISQVFTYNAYEDVTRIELRNLVFENDLPESLFHFEIPEGADVLELNE